MGELVKISLVLLAAGNSKRFGGNKLLFPVQGKPMYRHIVEQVELLPTEYLAEKLVVTQYTEIADDLHNNGYRVIFNHNSELGISHSIRLALDALPERAAIMFAVCDQPFLRSATLISLIKGYWQSGKGIGCLCFGERTGNPVIFSGEYIKKLYSLQGDKGGKQVVKQYSFDVYYHQSEQEEELSDVDFRLLT